MKIELKNIQHAAFASEETYCFDATVYIDGVKSGTVGNDGHGGCHKWSSNALQERIDAEALARKPEETFEPGDGLINDLFIDWLIAKDLKRAMNGRVLFLDDKGAIRQTKKQATAIVARVLADPVKVKQYWPNAKSILNLLPFDEALAIYKATAP